MINVAIDGPSGAGKSSIARQIASKLGYVYVDTGALYRTVGLAAVRSGFDPKDSGKVVPMLDFIKVELRYVDGEQRVFLNGEDVSEDIRLPEVSMAASGVSAIPQVRAFLFDLQRNIAAENNCLMDGRDIGTVVLPDADVKIFLTASPEVRADRRQKQLKEKGIDEPYENILSDIIQRDYNDSHRETAPLKQAEDAVLVVTDDLDFDGSVQAVIDIIKEKTKARQEQQ